MRAPSYQGDPTYLVTRFNPKTTRLLGHNVKVNGSMSASIDKNGDLVITGDYRFVYAVGSASGDGLPGRSLVHRIYQISVTKPREYGLTPGTSWIVNYTVNIANSACFVYNGFINPDFGSSRGAAPGKTIDPYSSADPLRLSDTGSSASPRPTGTPTECDSVSRL